MKHGTTGYTRHACRCNECRKAIRDYQRAYRERKRDPNPVEQDNDGVLGDLLHDLFPLGLTDDCPARRQHAATR